MKQFNITNTDSKSIIWIKTPKCAGSSFMQAIIDNNLPIDVIKWGLVSKFIKEKSAPYFNDAYKFAIVRNPFDRFVSSYHYCIQKKWVDKNITFKKFAKIPWKDIANGPYPRGPVIPVNKVYQHTRPLSLHLSYDYGNCDYINKFIHFENIEDELNSLLEKFSLPLVELPNLNSSARHRYQDYYDEETKRYVKEKFKEDLSLFNYSFDS